MTGSPWDAAWDHDTFASIHDGRSIMVAGGGWTVQIFPSGDAYIFDRPAHCDLRRTDATLADALLLLRKIMKLPGSDPDLVLSRLADVLGPMEALRFAKSLNGGKR